MKITVALILLLLLAPPVSYCDQAIICRDRNGFKTGSATITDDGSIIYRDKNGFKTGSAKMKNGKTTFYDKNGRKTGECSGYLPVMPGCNSTVKRLQP
jgi:hypothetical protein